MCTLHLEFAEVMLHRAFTSGRIFVAGQQGPEAEAGKLAVIVQTMKPC